MQPELINMCETQVVDERKAGNFNLDYYLRKNAAIYLRLDVYDFEPVLMKKCLYFPSRSFTFGRPVLTKLHAKNRGTEQALPS